MEMMTGLIGNIFQPMNNKKSFNSLIFSSNQSCLFHCICSYSIPSSMEKLGSEAHSTCHKPLWVKVYQYTNTQFLINVERMWPTTKSVFPLCRSIFILLNNRSFVDKPNQFYRWHYWISVDSGGTAMDSRIGWDSPFEAPIP